MFWFYLLREERAVKHWIIEGDLGLKELNDPTLFGRPYYLFNRTDDCLFCFYSAKELAENKIIRRYCEKRIKETLEMRQAIGFYLPRRNVERLIKEK